MTSKIQQHAVLGDPDILEQCGCQVEYLPYAFMPSILQSEKTDDQSRLPIVTVMTHPSGWKFHSFHRPILSEPEVLHTAYRIKSDLLQHYPSLGSVENKETWLSGDHLDINGFKLHLPPMLFAGDVMMLQAPLGKKTVSISPMDALEAWAAKHTVEECNINPLQVPKVPYANKWMAKLTQEFGQPSEPGQEHVFQQAVAGSEEAMTLTHIQASDWTYSSDYCLSLYQSIRNDHNLLDMEQILLNREILRAQSLVNPMSHSESVTRSNIEVASSSGIDFNMLRRRDLPILFYDELILYEDDLEDCGEVSYDAKIRVMPTCWFILLKFYVRIDHVIVRCRETRLYHQFQSTQQQEHSPCQIHMEVTWREQALSMEGAIGAGNPAASSLMRSKYGKDQSMNLPVVNEKYHIPQFYTITL